VPDDKHPIEQFIDLLNNNPDLKVRYLEDPDAAIAESGIEFDADTREALQTRDSDTLRRKFGEAVRQIWVFDQHVLWPQIDWADSNGFSIERVYRTGPAYVELWGWVPNSSVVVHVDGQDVGSTQMDMTGATDENNPFSFQWPEASYTAGEHTVGAYEQGDEEIAASIIVTVEPE
jgi:hypothetical protein